MAQMSADFIIREILRHLRIEGFWRMILQFILALGVKQLVGAGIIRLRHEDFREPVQVAVVGRAGIGKLLRGDDAVFVEHRHEHLGVDDRAGVEKFHARG